MSEDALITNAFSSYVEPAPARSPAQPPDIVGRLGVVGRGSGWFQVIGKCSSFDVMTDRLLTRLGSSAKDVIPNVEADIGVTRIGFHNLSLLGS